MKYITYLLLAGIWMMIPQSSSSQSIRPSVSTIQHNGASRPCIVVHIDPEPKTLKKAWRDFLKDNYNFKLKGIGFLTNKDLLSAHQIIVEQISSKEMDFFTRIIEDDNGTEMKVFAAFGYDMYVDSVRTPSEFNAMMKILDRFLEDYLPQYHQDLVKETEKAIEKLSRKQENLKKDIEKDGKEIEQLKKKIETLSKNLEINKENLKNAENKLENRKAKLQGVLKQYDEQ